MRLLFRDLFLPPNAQRARTPDYALPLRRWHQHAQPFFPEHQATHYKLGDPNRAAPHVQMKGWMSPNGFANVQGRSCRCLEE